MSLKLDLHVHSASRGEIFINANQLRKYLEHNKINGVAIVNFFDISHAISLKDEIKDYIIIVGQEIWSNEGHIIGLGLKNKIQDFQSAKEIIDCIHKQGGIAIAPHPYVFLGAGEKVMSFGIDAIESYNAFMGATIIPNYLAMKSAKKKNIPQVASTDTTGARFIGLSHTEVMVEDPNLIFDAIRSGNVRLHKKALPIPFKYILKNIFEFKDVEPCLTHAVPCFVCGKSMTIRLFKRKFQCIDCGVVQNSRIACCNGHYLCMKCIIKRDITIAEKL
ncbi:MAG: hypothetical protein AABY84_01620 [Candidatus Firestonebacteria bacterium]